MADIKFQCTNCGEHLNFVPEHAGTVQECFRCHQRVIVPGSAAIMATSAPAATPPSYQSTAVAQPLYHHEERSREAHVSRKLKMGAGCFAMIAVMFAVSLVGYGIGRIADVPDRQLQGWTTLIAGLAGVVAFIFFGYWATETAERSQDQGRR
jgi:hypothetical protein